jgi:starvation-inducible DNA-binding protein
MTTAVTDVANTEVIDRLNVNMAIAFDLYSQVKQAHWNIVGPNFIAVHLLLDQQAEMLATQTDTYAERLRAVGGVPSGTIRQAARTSTLPDLDARELPVLEAIEALVHRFEMYGDAVRDAADQAGESGDLGTQDVYVEAVREIDKQAWFLKSHLS